MATKKPVAKNAKAKPAKAAKPVAKKPVAKAPAKSAKPAAKAPAKPSAKPAAKKPAAKAPTKPVAKPVAKKPAAKAPAKPVAKPVAKKPAAKAPAKPIAKPVAKKPAAKAPAAKPAPKKAVAKAPAKPIAKKVAPKVPAKPAPKPMAKKEVSKAEPKPKEAPKKAETPAKVIKKNGPVKTIITSTTGILPKKQDVFKTNTFAASNLKNDTGKIIAHRSTAELKRKTEVEGLKKYQPEDRRSILDMSNTNTGPSYRYSEEDLQEFRELIQRKLETAKAELQYLQGVIMRKDEGGTEDTENKYQNMEDGSASMEREQFTQLASRQITFISHLEQAMVRIENKTYGICRETGKLIDKARLRAVPHATLSIEAKNAKKN